METFYLNFTTSKDDLDVAARENASSEKSIHDLSDLVRRITLQDKVEESEYGKFGWVVDPEGNKVELWQPPAGF
jgi:hypothetical protein